MTQVSERVEAEMKRYYNQEIGRALTSICMRNSPATARAEFDQAAKEIKTSIAAGEFTQLEWLACLRGCV